MDERFWSSRERQPRVQPVTTSASESSTVKASPDIGERIQSRQQELQLIAEILNSPGNRAYHQVSVIGVIGGLFLCIGGIVISLLGLAGSIEFVFEAGGLRAGLSNATPGIIVCLIGMLILWRFKVKTRDTLKIDFGAMSTSQDAAVSSSQGVVTPGETAPREKATSEERGSISYGGER